MNEPIMTSASPTVRTQVPTGTPGFVSGGGAAAGSRIGSLQSALSGFFGQVHDLAADHANFTLREDLRKIDQENERLSTEGAVAGSSGQGADPEKMKRYDYFKAYNRTAADLPGSQDGQEYVNSLSQLDRSDPTFDIEKNRQDFIRQKFGKGSGTPEYDAAYLAAFNRATDAPVAAFKQATIQTAQSNAIKTFQGEIAGWLQNAQGVPGFQMADWHERATALTRGDTEAGEKIILGALDTAISNPGQAESALAAMRTSGLHEKYPDMYARMESVALKNIVSVQTYAGAKAWSNMQTELLNVMADPNATVKDVASLAPKVMDVFQRHGGLGQKDQLLSSLYSKAHELAGKQADVNSILVSYYGGKHLVQTMTERGKAGDVGKVLDEQFVPALSEIVTSNPEQFPELSRVGVVNPLASRKGAVELAGIISNPTFANASAGGIPSGWRTMLGQAITDLNDKERASNAFALLDRYAAVHGPAAAGRLLDSDEARGQYAALRSIAAVGQPIESYLALRRDNPDLADLRKDAARGVFHFAALLGKSEAKDSELREEVYQKLQKGFAKELNSDWFGGPGAGDLVIGNSADRDAMMGLVVETMLAQKKMTGTASIDTAVEEAAKQLRGQYDFIPTVKGRFQAVKDGWGGKGRDLNHPIAVVAGQKVYAPGKVINALGDSEDTVATYGEDLDAFGKAFPGLAKDRKLGLWGQDLKADGLFRVVTDSGRSLVLVPGSTLALPVSREVEGKIGETAQAVSTTGDVHGVETPKDPLEFERFVKARLPAGFHLVDDGAINGVRAYHIAYGFRVKAHDREQAILDAEFKRGVKQQQQEDAQKVTQTSVGTLLKLPLGM